MKNKFLPITITIVSILVTALLGSIFVYIGMPWYMTLSRPSAFVPNILIPIVWTVIYIMFAVILSVIIDTSLLDYKSVILLIANSLLNILWCLTFFTLQSTLVGLVVIHLNLVLGILLIKHLFTRNRLYSILLSIYPFWLCIATSLNLALWILN